MARQRRTSRPLQSGPGLFDSLGDDLMGVSTPRKPRSRKQQTADDSLEMKPMAEVPYRRLMFLSFGSGSSGNCAYLGTPQKGLLIDAGVDSKAVLTALEQNGISQNAIRGIILTHDHGDHIRYLYSFLRRNHHLPVYSTQRVLQGLFRRHNISRRVKDHHVPIYKEITFTVGDDFRVTAFETSHDGSDNCGFHIAVGHDDAHTFVVTTDTGYITPRADYYMRRARYLMVESNYDMRMLESGPYPDFLKARIVSNSGHLDNVDTAAWLRSAIKEGDGYLTHVFLCHLSHENNTPEIALRSAREGIEDAGYNVVDANTYALPTLPAHSVALAALPRHECSPLYVFHLSDEE